MAKKLNPMEREVRKERKRIQAIRAIFKKKGITGDDACNMILEMRKGKPFP